MRICLVGPAHPYRGGISHFTQMLAREFQSAHEVRIVGYSRLYPSLLFPGRTQYDEGGALVQVESLRVIDSTNPLSYRRAADAVLEFEPDLVVIKWWHPFFAPALRSIAAAVKRRSKAPVVFLCHNVLPHEGSSAATVLARWGLRAADAFLVQSREDLATLKQIVPNAVAEVHPHPTYTQFAKSAITRSEARQQLGLDGRVLLFFGLVRAYKGLDDLLRAVALLPPDLTVTLLIVGEFYEARERYDRLIQALGIAQRVRVVDRYVPDAEVAQYFMAADLVVLPYRSASQSGIAQTAFAFERPVVVTAVGGLPDVVEDGVTGYVVPPHDPAALVAAITRFFAGDDASRMPPAIRANASRFTWAGCARALIALGERVRSS
ncbi:MAG TPA: glycosyltransferase [Candidatus Krumholzibacteria bacterium]|nr:glycosyltransferase [Candidatus Krumholzibacteria bacterium]